MRFRSRLPLALLAALAIAPLAFATTDPPPAIPSWVTIDAAGEQPDCPLNVHNPTCAYDYVSGTKVDPFNSANTGQVTGLKIVSFTFGAAADATTPVTAITDITAALRTAFSIPSACSIGDPGISPDGTKIAFLVQDNSAISGETNCVGGPYMSYLSGQGLDYDLYACNGFGAGFTPTSSNCALIKLSNFSNNGGFIDPHISPDGHIYLTERLGVVSGAIQWQIDWMTVNWSGTPSYTSETTVQPAPSGLSTATVIAAGCQLFYKPSSVNAASTVMYTEANLVAGPWTGVSSWGGPCNNTNGGFYGTGSFHFTIGSSLLTQDAPLAGQALFDAAGNISNYHEFPTFFTVNGTSYLMDTTSANEPSSLIDACASGVIPYMGCQPNYPSDFEILQLNQSSLAPTGTVWPLTLINTPGSNMNAMLQPVGYGGIAHPGLNVADGFVLFNNQNTAGNQTLYMPLHFPGSVTYPLQSSVTSGAATVTGSVATTRVTTPDQPQTGFGSNQYPYTCAYSGTLNDSGTGDLAQNYSIATPMLNGAPKATGVYVGLIHGYNLYPTDLYYHNWIAHLCQKGYGVIAPDYQTNGTATSAYINKAADVLQKSGTGSAFARILANSGTYMQPIADGSGGYKTAVVGHSVGGWLTWGLINASYAGGYNLSAITVGVPFAPVTPVTGTYFSGTSIPNTAIVPSFFGAADPITPTGIRTCMAGTMNLNASSVPVANKPLFGVQSDTHGTPPQYGNHYWILSSWYTPAGYVPDSVNVNTVDSGTNIMDYTLSFAYSEMAAACVAGTADACTGLTATSVPYWNWTDGTAAVVPTFYSNTTAPTVTALVAASNGGTC